MSRQSFFKEKNCKVIVKDLNLRGEKREKRNENTFSILCTKESADPMAETHKMTALDMPFKDNLQDMFPAFIKCRGANVLKNMGTDSLNF